MDDFCGKCDKQFARNDIFIVPCRGLCKKFFHRACCEGQISEYDVKLLRQNRHLGYFCNECVGMSAKFAEAHDSIMESQKAGFDKILNLFDAKYKPLCDQVEQFKVHLDEQLHKLMATAKEKASHIAKIANEMSEVKHSLRYATQSNLDAAVSSAATLQITDSDNRRSSFDAPALSYPPIVTNNCRSPIVAVPSSSALSHSLSLPKQKISWAQTVAGVSPTASCSLLGSAAFIPSAVAVNAADNHSHASTGISRTAANLCTPTNSPAPQPPRNSNWIRVGKNNRRKQISVVGSSLNSDLDVAIRMKWLHLSSFLPSVTAESIIDYVMKHAGIDKHQLSCYKLVKKDTPIDSLKRINFKLGVANAYYEKLLSPDLWPADVKLRPFRFFPKEENRATIL